MATLAPPLSPRHGSFFELHKKWRRRLFTSHLQQEERERAAREAEMESKARACTYLTTFLHHSPWTDQLDQISIVWDSVPSMETLQSYAHLDEKEGTLSCRRLFKAVVVWDELGHLLWQTLKATSEQQQDGASSSPRLASLTTTTTTTTTPPEIFFTEVADTFWCPPLEYSFRRGSHETSDSSLASRGSITTNSSPFSFDRDYSTFSSMSSSSRDPSLMAGANQNRKRNDSLSAMIPRAISISCVSAVKKTLGVFSDKQTT